MNLENSVEQQVNQAESKSNRVLERWISWSLREEEHIAALDQSQMRTQQATKTAGYWWCREQVTMGVRSLCTSCWLYWCSSLLFARLREPALIGARYKIFFFWRNGAKQNWYFGHPRTGSVYQNPDSECLNCTGYFLRQARSRPGLLCCFLADTPILKLSGYGCNAQSASFSRY